MATLIFVRDPGVYVNIDLVRWVEFLDASGVQPRGDQRERDGTPLEREIETAIVHFQPGGGNPDGNPTLILRSDAARALWRELRRRIT